MLAVVHRASLAIALATALAAALAASTAARAQEAANAPERAETLDLDSDVVEWAEYIGIDAIDLQGAVYTTGLSAEDYLVAVGHVERVPIQLATAPPSVAQIAPGTNDWPIGGALGQRIYCIEGIESNHGRYMYNPMPWGVYGEHAQGWLGYLPSTARGLGVAIGNRASEWNGAARMLATGRGREFAGVAFGIC